MKKIILSLIEWHVKFSKIITAACLSMSILICAWAMSCHVFDKPVDPTTLGVLLAPWQLELGFNMAIKISDISKEKKKTEENYND